LKARRRCGFDPNCQPVRLTSHSADYRQAWWRGRRARRARRARGVAVEPVEPVAWPSSPSSPWRGRRARGVAVEPVARCHVSNSPAQPMRAAKRNKISKTHILNAIIFRERISTRNFVAPPPPNLCPHRLSAIYFLHTYVAVMACTRVHEPIGSPQSNAKETRR